MLKQGSILLRKGADTRTDDGRPPEDRPVLTGFPKSPCWWTEVTNPGEQLLVVRTAYQDMEYNVFS